MKKFTSVIFVIVVLTVGLECIHGFPATVTAQIVANRGWADLIEDVVKKQEVPSVPGDYKSFIALHLKAPIIFNNLQKLIKLPSLAVGPVSNDWQYDVAYVCLDPTILIE
ncbi:hypothetical protein DMENIID0001_104070 [Sergentomyia squamirostris]